MAVGTRTLVGAEASNTGVRRFDFPELGRVIYGDGAVDQLGDEVRRLGGSRVLLVTSPSLAKQHDLMSRIRTALGDACLLYTSDRPRVLTPRGLSRTGAGLILFSFCDRPSARTSR